MAIEQQSTALQKADMPDPKHGSSNQWVDTAEPTGEQNLNARTEELETLAEDDSEQNHDNAGSDEDGGDGDNGEEESEDGDIPLELNYEAIKHVATCYLPGGHGRCIDVKQLAQGGFHEVKTLHFEDGWICIGRFLLEKQTLGFAESEVVTMRYVREHTTIPLPEVYFVNYNPDHVVGAPFMLMEYIEGTALHIFWHDLSLDHKKAVISQIADIMAQLASLEFDVIGSLTGSGIGPSRERHFEDYVDGIGPYETLEAYFYGLMDISPSMSCCDECAQWCAEIRPEVKKYFEKEEGMARVCGAPFALIHGDFDMQNMLFNYSADDDEPPKLTGIIDWDGSQTIPLYFLYDYPFFIQDSQFEIDEPKFPDNKILRQHLVHELAAKHPEGSQRRQDVRDCFYKKNYFLHHYAGMFPKKWDEHDSQASTLRYFLRDYYEGYEGPYNGKVDWEPDTDSEKEESDSEDSEDEDSEGEESADGEDSDEGENTGEDQSSSDDEAQSVNSSDESGEERLSA